MIKRYNLIIDYLGHPDGYTTNYGHWCKYSDVEKIIELNKEMLEVLKVITHCKDSRNLNLFESDAKRVIKKAEQLND